MDGAQDLGGKMNFGAIAPEAGEPVFHHEWEARALGLTLAANGLGYWSIDESRHARESLSPIKYYSMSYYEIWYEGVVSLLKKHGELTQEELDQVQAMRPGNRTDRRVLRTRRSHTSCHTRLPAYARGVVGTVEAVRGMHVFPDTCAHGQGEQPQWLYTIMFSGSALWGEDAEPGLTCSIDAWESYLENE